MYQNGTITLTGVTRYENSNNKCISLVYQYGTVFLDRYSSLCNTYASLEHTIGVYRIDTTIRIVL